MPLQTDNQQLGNINQTIQTTADINIGAQTAAAAARVGGVLDNMGSNLSAKYGTKYGQQRATEDAMKQIDKGAAGEYSHIANFTPYGDAYNAMMDKIAPNVLSADIGHDINLYSSKIATDPNVPSDKKVKMLSDGIKGIIDESVNSISPEWRDQVRLTTAMQGLDAQNKMVQQVANIQTAQQQIGVKDSMDKLGQQAQLAESPELAMQSLEAIKQNGLALVGSGTVSAAQADAYYSNYKSQVVAQQIEKHGFDKFKAWNDSTNTFSEADMQQFQHSADIIYSQKQHAIEVDQIRHGINFEQNLSGFVDGTMPNQPTFKMSDQQSMLWKQAGTARQLYTAARSMGELQQQSMLSSAAYNSLPSQLKSMVNANLAKITHTRAAGDFTDYGMNENTPFDQRLANAQQMGIAPDKLLTKSEKAKIELAFISNPEAAKGMLTQMTNPQFAAHYMKGYAKNNDKPMPAMTNKFAQLDSTYMSGIKSPTTAKNLTVKNAPSLFALNSISDMPVNTAAAMYDHIKVASKGNPLKTPEDLYKERYTNVNNGVVIKGHEKLLYPNNTAKLASKLTKDVKEQNAIKDTLENGSIIPDFENDRYIVRKTGRKPIAISFDEVDQLSGTNSGTSINLSRAKAASNFSVLAANPMVSAMIGSAKNILANEDGE